MNLNRFKANIQWHEMGRPSPGFVLSYSNETNLEVTLQCIFAKKNKKMQIRPVSVKLITTDNITL